MLTDFLVCPVCKGTVYYDREKPSFVCIRCLLSFPIKNGVPDMIEGDASPIEFEFAEKLRKKNVSAGSAS